MAVSDIVLSLLVGHDSLIYIQFKFQGIYIISNNFD